MTPAITAAGETQLIYADFLNCDDRVFTKPLSVFEKTQEITARFMDAIRETAYKVEETLHRLKSEQDERRAALTNLRKNIKDYPAGLRQLKERISAELKRQTGREVQIDILADVLEIAEGEGLWRKAVEGYLNA